MSLGSPIGTPRLATGLTGCAPAPRAASPVRPRCALPSRSLASANRLQGWPGTSGPGSGRVARRCQATLRVPPEQHGSPDRTARRPCQRGSVAARGVVWEDMSSRVSNRRVVEATGHVQPSVVMGVDAFRAGWVAIVLRDGKFGAADADASLPELIGRHGDAGVVGVDMPIGLPLTTGRVCDVLARQLIGVRRSSVFLAPPLEVLKPSPTRPPLREQRN